MLEWFSRTTSISGVQISNYWMLVLVAVVVIWIIYRLSSASPQSEITRAGRVFC
jgi:hypothetical protein